MPSTDLNGEPILIFNRAMLAPVVSIIDEVERTRKLTLDEQALLDRILATFPELDSADRIEREGRFGNYR